MTLFKGPFPLNLTASLTICLEKGRNIIRWFWIGQINARLNISLDAPSSFSSNASSKSYSNLLLYSIAHFPVSSKQWIFKS